MRMPTIDVVVPAYNEEPCIGKTIETLFSRLGQLPYRFELIVVDDGSEDATAEIVKRYLDRYPVTLVTLTRNFGKETALLAGLDRARGDATIVMDADLQHPVEMIAEFLAQWEAGFQCVYGVRRDRRDETILKRTFARLFYLGINSGSIVRVVPDAVDFRLLDKAAVRALCSIRERVRFTKGLYAWLGFRSIGIPFVPAPRAKGHSRFDRRSLSRLAWDGLTSFSDLPLRLAGIIGGAAALGALAYAMFMATETLAFGIAVPGWLKATDAITFLSGLQILLLGILGQYMRNVFIEAKHRPNYLIRELHGIAASREGLSLDQPRQLSAEARAVPSSADLVTESDRIAVA